jgi:ATP-dependent Clp protease ATP-binding subunit ClpC
MGSPEIGSEHLLLGLLLEREGVGAQVLEDLGVDAKKVRDELLRLRS